VALVASHPERETSAAPVHDGAEPEPDPEREPVGIHIAPS